MRPARASISVDSLQHAQYATRLCCGSVAAPLRFTLVVLDSFGGPMVPRASHVVVSSALRRLALNSLIACWPIALVAGPVSAGTFTVFGPHSYQRGTGKPVTERAAFSVLNRSVPYLLRI